ncbi:RPS5B [Symbiodinium natans]|uniref:RPS5B protein n=1 Tax=Symbiodinium natans TaxID=878477 RepID=A0A812RVT5_9DINO|nr:RPS5B [Symbiodinium natans]
MSATEVKLFGKWTYEDVMLSDLSLVDYIAVNKAAQSFLPHTQGRYQMRRFRKALCPIVERLCCSIMMHGRNNGKKLMAVRIVKHAFEIIHLLTDKNPIQVFVDAVKNGGPREDSTRVGSAGVVRRQAVDVSPLRRVNQAIYLICTGARNSAFRNIKSISECLADEIMNAAKESSNSDLAAQLAVSAATFQRMIAQDAWKFLKYMWVNSVASDIPPLTHPWAWGLPVTASLTFSQGYAIKKKACFAAKVSFLHRINEHVLEEFYKDYRVDDAAMHVGESAARVILLH